jgi:non-ribosomal peptide synthetase component E (peptide arylation enzyme)
MSMLPATDIGPTEETGPLTAEGLLRRRARQRPNATALVDPPNREVLGLGRPRSLTYREADAAVDALASFFIELGLEPGDRIAVQLPNVIEAPLTLLTAWRAGLTVAMLPLLWRGVEIGKICEAVEPKALVGVAEFAGERNAEMLREIAVAHLSVRFVLGFGAGLPDGVASLEEAIDVGMAWSQTPSRAAAGKAPAMINFSARRNAPLVPLFRSEDEIWRKGR